MGLGKPLLAAGLLLTLVACGSPTPTPIAGLPTPTKVTQARVVQVIDGDTIVVEWDRAQQKVRYIGIDTPESWEPCGSLATARNHQLVVGRSVALEKDRSETDRYGRLLRYVWIGPTMVNAVLVAEGYARSYPTRVDTKYRQLFEDLYREVKASRRGCWR